MLLRFLLGVVGPAPDALLLASSALSWQTSM
jgi:hypothetical protein